MKKNRLLWISLCLIGIGLAGVTATGIGNRDQGRMMMETAMMRDMMDHGQMKEMMRQMMGGILPPGMSPQRLPDPDSAGANLLATYCTQCHDLPSPTMHTEEDWPRIAERMLARERMMAAMMQIKSPTTGEEGILVNYLKEHALKGVTPGSLPELNSPGAILFQQTCAQCHALPDPKQHSVSEWPGVVERMRSNMQSMGKRVITEREKTEIIGYLAKHAGK